MTDLSRLSPDLIARADHRLVRTVDALPDAAYAQPSLLPGWRRSHVVAHLTLNAEGLAGVLHGAHVGSPQPMYASAEARDADIDELATADPADLRDRFLAATEQFLRALGAMHDADWEGRFERVPDGPTFALVNVPLMRLREVEIHHADLDAGYSCADWPAEFSELLLESARHFSTTSSFSVRPTDLDRTWHYGDDEGGPVVTGTAGALGWWLTGRGAGEGLESSSGVLPETESW